VKRLNLKIIKNEMEDQDLNPEDEADVKSYFQKLIKQ